MRRGCTDVTKRTGLRQWFQSQGREGWAPTINARTIASHTGLLLAVAALSVLLVACGQAQAQPAASSTRPQTTTAPAPPTISLDIAEDDGGFVPASITVQPGQVIKFTFTNQGKAVHNLRIAGPDGRYDSPGNAVADPVFVQPGQTSTLEWKAPAQTGTVQFRCDFHPDHVGTITVR